MKRSLALAGLLTLLPFPLVAQAPNPAAPLSRTTVEAQIKGNFARTDTNHDGLITRAEADAARNASMVAQFSAAFNAMDANKDGNLSRAEFVAANQKAMTAAIQKQGAADRAFAAGDLNRDGSVSLAEASSQPLREFDRLDTNHDALLSPAERKAAAKQGGGK